MSIAEERVKVKVCRKYFYEDLSFWALVVSNLAVIVWALAQQWPIGTIMWIYWGQSVSIGIFWFSKLLSLKQFSTKDFKINDRPVEPTRATKIQTSVFFLIHYGFFHLGYAVFLCAEFGFAPFYQALAPIGIFAIYQGHSFFYHRKWLARQKPNIGTMMFFPYARIIPMHLTIIFAFTYEGQTYALVLFLFLKLLADVFMHIVERRNFAD